MKKTEFRGNSRIVLQKIAFPVAKNTKIIKRIKDTKNSTCLQSLLQSRARDPVELHHDLLGEKEQGQYGNNTLH